MRKRHVAAVVVGMALAPGSPFLAWSQAQDGPGRPQPSGSSTEPSRRGSPRADSSQAGQTGANEVVRSGTDSPADSATLIRQQEKARRLIEQLASDQFAERERATAQLILLGLPAVEPLREASRSDDREVQQRSQMVLSVVHELDFQNRLESFEQSEDADKSYGLPGWDRFRELVGHTAAARELFAAMQKAERSLLSAELEEGEQAAEALARNCQRLRFSVQIFGARHELPPIAAALFVATNPDIPLRATTHSALVNLVQQDALKNALASESHEAMIRRLLAAWILRDDAVPANQLLLMALQHQIDQVLPRARKIAKRPFEADSFDRYFAVLCLAKFGDKDDLSILVPLMDDKKIVTSYRLNNKTYDVQMRDVVLAALLMLTKNDPSEFAYGRLRVQEPDVFDTMTLGFSRDEDRQQAMAKWESYWQQAGDDREDSE